MKVKLNGNDLFEVSSQFGIIDKIHPDGHTGLDLVMESGTQLFSPVNGVIEKIVDYGQDNIGKGIIIRADSGESVIMGHLSDVKAHVGDRVSEGDFVAYSGNTGHSTGSHLHLGLKDTNGEYVNPEPLVSNNDDGVISWDKFLDNGSVNNFQPNVKDQNIFDFISSWREHGFWEAMYGKPFFQVCTDFLKELFHDIGLFILGNGDIFFLMPAIILMFGTFIIGKNKYSKFIIPLWFAYFVTSMFHKMML